MEINWDALGATGEWAGAIVVVLTLVYLAKQVSQSNLIGKAEAERDWLVGWHNATHSLAEDEQIANVMLKGFADYSALTKAERVVFHGRMSLVIDHADLLVRLSEKGLVPDDWLGKVLTVCLSFIESEGGKAWWSSVGHGFGIKSFLDEYQATLSEPVPPIGDYFPVWSIGDA